MPTQKGFGLLSTQMTLDDKENLLSEKNPDFYKLTTSIAAFMFSDRLAVRRKILLTIVCAFLATASFSQSAKDRWIDSVFHMMDESAKIGQLFIVPLSSNWEKSKLNNIEQQIRAQGIGGLLFTTGHPLRQSSITNDFQSASRIPMLIAMDASHGLSTMLDSTIVFPNELSLASVSDSLLYDFGRETGRQLRELGVTLNLSPVLNLSINASGVPSQQTFGENAGWVTQKSSAIFKGFSSCGILGAAKYFPVQGITVTEIKKDFPKAKLFVDTLQASPFRELFDEGVRAVIPSAAELPLFYETKNSAKKNRFTSSQLLSAALAGDWIKKSLSFKGLVIVDVRPIVNSTKKLKNGEAELFSFRAGNDMIITDDPQAALRRIKRLLRKEKEYKLNLEIAVRKILAAKFDAGLHTLKKINRENLMLRLWNREALVLQRNLYRNAITVPVNGNNAVPVLALENKKIISVVVGDSIQFNPLQHSIRKYADVREVNITRVADLEKRQGLFHGYDLVLVAFKSRADQKMVEALADSARRRPANQQWIAASLACPFFAAVADNFSSSICAFNDDVETQEMIPEIIFGGSASAGKLPVNLGASSVGTGLATKPIGRFQYGIPEEVGISRPVLEKIQSITEEAIKNGGTPGCHVLVAKDGKVVYDRSFGFLTYEKQTAVTDSTIFDLASITKVSATLQTVMFMHDRGLIDINKKASVYLPELRGSNKKDITLKDILTHQAGLWPFLPFWAQTMKDSVHLPEFYQKQPSLEYPYMVADNLYASVGMKDSLWSWIIRAKIREKPSRTPFDYRYSDMGFYILQHVAEKILNQPIHEFVQQNLYEPLGAHTMGYLPLLRFRVSRIAPTENDKLFRKSLLIGTVHDQGAAMHGGVAGHAGLFGTAHDLGKLGQMLLQEGYYGGYQYYRPETVRLFTSKQFVPSRRGLGWDKPIQSDWNSPTSLSASPRTFGHTGFTGTCIWVDPEFNLVYVFLSNRVHPDMTNNKLLSSNIRSRIQDVIYQSIFEYCNTGKGSPEQADYVKMGISRQ
jgi:beta-N-acetylhexosaminidase